MQTRIIRVGNSQGIVLPKKLIQQYQLSDEVILHSTPEGLLITPVAQPARQGWAEQFAAAQAAGQEPESELLEGFTNSEFEDTEWTWYTQAKMVFRLRSTGTSPPSPLSRREGGLVLILTT